ncbi:MAG: bifunctional 2-keto-4-hydroxyglutarate aldolase/2-keto-3-deoxy-6-phosphogluconate aldolase [Veillonellaceae bacterium]|jgi:2-dehydro-3-deoxyphosphogluconate aldolase/(4S)-4-hydroxy-2-oxoglutarate aldolase|nr:bifunctional 2-keto-4-hydroxyglutarate aldolase/2-keto-3-deoxy-6-phosphogluconate aldolase [Veillonellaceae bacterium]
MAKLDVINKVLQSGIVAIVRTDNAEKAKKIVEAISAGGIKVIEVTMSVPGAIEVIRELSGYCAQTGITLGVGSVLDPETARSAILAGAEYVVTPCLNPDVIKLCNRYQVPSMPGAMSVREVVEALEAGADIVKVFPGELLGPQFIKAVHGPIPQAPLMPTGGVTADNVKDWLAAGAVALGVGGSLTAGAKTGDYAAVTAAAKLFVEKIREARNL